MTKRSIPTSINLLNHAGIEATVSNLSKVSGYEEGDIIASLGRNSFRLAITQNANDDEIYNLKDFATVESELEAAHRLMVEDIDFSTYLTVMKVANLTQAEFDELFIPLIEVLNKVGLDEFGLTQPYWDATSGLSIPIYYSSDIQMQGILPKTLNALASELGFVEKHRIRHPEDTWIVESVQYPAVEKSDF